MKRGKSREGESEDGQQKEVWSNERELLGTRITSYMADSLRINGANVILYGAFPNAIDAIGCFRPCVMTAATLCRMKYGIM